MYQFAAPSAGIRPADIVEHLVIAYPTSYEKEVTTTFGVKDAIALDVADVNTGEIHKASLWFNGPVVGRLRRHIGELVLGHIIEGDPKPGQKPPMLFQYANEDAAAVAAGQAFIAAHPEFGATEATTPAVPAATTPVAAPAPAGSAAPAAAGGISPDVLAALPAESRALIEQLSTAQTA